MSIKKHSWQSSISCDSTTFSITSMKLLLEYHSKLYTVMSQFFLIIIAENAGSHTCMIFMIC